MTEQHPASESLEADAHDRAPADATPDAAPPHAESDAQARDGEGEGDGEHPSRPRRPGRLERQLARARAEADEARAHAAEAAAAAQHYARQLAEAQEAGNRVAADGVSARIARAEDAMRNAIHAGDADAVVKAQSELGRLHAVAAQIANAPPPRAPAAPAPAQRPAPQQYTDTTREWLDANPWYGSDPELTAVAKAAHAAAKRNGVEVDTPEYWRAIERAVAAVDPSAVADAAPARPAPRAPAPPARSAPVTRNAAHAPQGVPGEVRLTADEATAAAISGMTPQEYKSWQSRLRAAGRLPATAGAR